MPRTYLVRNHNRSWINRFRLGNRNRWMVKCSAHAHAAQVVVVFFSRMVPIKASAILYDRYDRQASMNNYNSACFLSLSLGLGFCSAQTLRRLWIFNNRFTFRFGDAIFNNNNTISEMQKKGMIQSWFSWYQPYLRWVEYYMFDIVFFFALTMSVWTAAHHDPVVCMGSGWLSDLELERRTDIPSRKSIYYDWTKSIDGIG